MRGALIVDAHQEESAGVSVFGPVIRIDSEQGPALATAVMRGARATSIAMGSSQQDSVPKPSAQGTRTDSLKP